MVTSIALIRGVNVGGKSMTTADLKKALEPLGFGNVRTYIQSGNVVFDHPRKREQEVVESLVESIASFFGFETKVIVRSGTQFSPIISNFPFTEKQMDWSHVTFLSAVPPETLYRAFHEKKSKSEECVISGREVYLYCPDGYGRSKLSNSFIERAAGVPATTRNWRTVLALGEMAGARPRSHP